MSKVELSTQQLAVVPTQSRYNTLKSKAVLSVAVASTLVGMSMPAFAEGEALEIPDMSPIVTMISGMVAVVASVGMAVLSVYATAKVFKWVKAAF